MLTPASTLDIARTPVLTPSKRPSKRPRVRRPTAALAAAAAFSAASESSYLFSIGEGLVRGIVLQRPSAGNKSPYVGDVRLSCGRVALVHMPSMDMGGKCFPGVECLLKTQVNKAGLPIGPNAMGSKTYSRVDPVTGETTMYKMAKCEFTLQLLRAFEPENKDLPGGDGGCWVGAHPSLGEKAASALLEGDTLVNELGGVKIEKVQREVQGVAGTDMRCDFLLTHADGSKTVVEVKTVVDTDFDPTLSPPDRFPVKKSRPPIVLGTGYPYKRAAIFPWGGGNQKGPDGEKVVSSRAIKHVRELTDIARGVKTEEGIALKAAVLFVVVRGDAQSFRPNKQACPSFARYLREAKAAGVRVIARRVRFGEAAGESLGTAIDDGPIEVDLGFDRAP